MGKTTAPLLSFDARGSVAKTVVYSSWRGVSYARRHVIPGNPNSLAQQFQRNSFATLREMWKIAPELVQAPWLAFATGRPFTGMNAFLGENRRAMTTDSDMEEFIGSPGARGGLPAASMVGVAGGGSGEIDVTFTVDTPPSGWTLEAAIAMAFPDQAPDVRFVGPMVVDEDTSAPYEITLTGLGSAVDCIVAGWLRWEKPNGQIAYSVSITDPTTSGA